MRADFADGRTAVTQQAIRHKWPIKPETMARVIEGADAILQDEEEPTPFKLGAMKVLIMADAANIKIEANDIQDGHNEAMEAIEGYRAALNNPKLVEAVADMADDYQKEVKDCPSTETHSPSTNGHVNGKLNGHATNGKPHPPTSS